MIHRLNGLLYKRKIWNNNAYKPNPYGTHINTLKHFQRASNNGIYNARTKCQLNNKSFFSPFYGPFNLSLHTLCTCHCVPRLVILFAMLNCWCRLSDLLKHAILKNIWSNGLIWDIRATLINLHVTNVMYICTLISVKGHNQFISKFRI